MSRNPYDVPASLIPELWKQKMISDMCGSLKSQDRAVDAILRRKNALDRAKKYIRDKHKLFSMPPVTGTDGAILEVLNELKRILEMK